VKGENEELKQRTKFLEARLEQVNVISNIFLHTWNTTTVVSAMVYLSILNMMQIILSAVPRTSANDLVKQGLSNDFFWWLRTI
jgi:hypothetical protein